MLYFHWPGCRKFHISQKKPQMRAAMATDARPVQSLRFVLKGMGFAPEAAEGH